MPGAERVNLHVYLPKAPAVLLALAVFVSNLFSLVLVLIFVAYMNRFQIGPEERALADLCGEGFLAYRRTVRRWL